MKSMYYDLLDEIKNFFKRSHQKKAVVGLSGGIDSAVCLKLVADSIGAKNVTALLMPEIGLTKGKNIIDAKELATKLKVRQYTVDIADYLNTFDSVTWKQSKIALMNTKARVRALLLYNYANSNNAMVIGTSNKSEILLGYGTKYGDLAVDVFVIGDMLKSEVISLAKFMNIPETIIRKKPSAELTVGQNDQADLGASYSKLDKILKKYLEGEKLNKKDHLIKKTLQRVEKNKHKRTPIPILELK